MRLYIAFGLALVTLVLLTFGVFYPKVNWLWMLWGPIAIKGFWDFFQMKHTIRRNFPLIGEFRYIFEKIRPEINQYFIESNSDGVPFSREERSIVYQRAKRELDTLPFGTQRKVYEVGYEWVNHSLAPTHVEIESLRLTIGGDDCKQPYNSSLLNISAMSFGSLSNRAILALNGGAKKGGFAHNTGEGGITPYHLQFEGDLIWQLGTGYFGARKLDGTFCDKQFEEKSNLPQVKMIEIKLSQGAKPGHGGILPAAKVTKEIAEIRNVPEGKDVISPPAHSAFGTPIGLLEFLAELRKLSKGKPVGIKLCIGKRREFLALCKAMVKTGITPDFISVDGGEGGTGAAPLEFSNSIGCPLTEALIFTDNALRGFDLRDKIRVIAAGKVVTGFDMIKRIALGADLCYAARSMMMALGCIQALRCNSNHCPTGVTTQNKQLISGLNVPDKAERVACYHYETLESFAEILGAMGLQRSNDLRPWHIVRRTDFNLVQHYAELVEHLSPGDLLSEPLPKTFAKAWKAASPDTFRHAPDTLQTASL